MLQKISSEESEISTNDIFLWQSELELSYENVV